MVFVGNLLKQLFISELMDINNIFNRIIMKKNYKFIKIFLVILLSMTACDKNTNNSEISDGNGNSSAHLIGTWKLDSVKSYYYLMRDGNGYYESYNSYNGIYKRSLKWEADNYTITIELLKDDYYSSSTSSYTISENSGTLQFSSKKYVYTKISGTVTNEDYRSKPYDNYIRIMGYYYELSEAVMRCSHATGTESNFKHLFFNGTNGTTDPYGAIFAYATPYYEGINKEWLDGSYSIKQGGSHWIYTGWYYHKGSSLGQCEGKLNIKTSGKIKVFDFNLSDGDCVGHFAGNWYYK